jgi:methyl-accepting chemotaxis protein
MSLRTKLVSAFGAIALITLGVSILGYWQVKKLGSALYEIGVVRLPSIEGLEMMQRARISLEASERTLLLPSIDDTTMAAEVERQKEAWELAERGWNLYEPLPQTKEEQIKWRSFVPAWRAWKAEYQAVVSLSVESHKIGDRALLAKASEKRLTASKLAAESGALLSEITAINNQVTSDAKQQSVASYQDMILGQNVMLFSAVAGVVGALCFGLFMGRRLADPLFRWPAPSPGLPRAT